MPRNAKTLIALLRAAAAAAGEEACLRACGRTADLRAHRAYQPGEEVFDSYGPWCEGAAVGELQLPVLLPVPAVWGGRQLQLSQQDDDMSAFSGRETCGTGVVTRAIVLVTADVQAGLAG